jgi:hypothetical protein
VKWLKGRDGDKWHRIDVYRGRKRGIRYTVAPCYGNRWYVTADLPNGTAENSLWERHGEQHFGTPWHAQTFAETWLQQP